MQVLESVDLVRLQIYSVWKCNIRKATVVFTVHCLYFFQPRWLTNSICLQGYYKVLGKGHLPKQPVIVKAKFFSKTAEKRIKDVGGACVLVAWSCCRIKLFVLKRDFVFCDDIFFSKMLMRLVMVSMLLVLKRTRHEGCMCSLYVGSSQLSISACNIP